MLATGGAFQVTEILPVPEAVAQHSTLRPSLVDQRKHSLILPAAGREIAGKHPPDSPEHPDVI